MTDSRPARSGPPPAFSPDVLMGLIREPLDPGYAEAAARRADPGRDGPGHRALAAAGAFLIGLILVVAYSQEHRSAPGRAAIHDELVSQVQHAERVNDDLESAARRLSEQVREARDAANPAGPGSAAALQALEITSGARGVIGPGVSVTLADAAAPTSDDPTAGGRSGAPGPYRPGAIGDRELRSVVNALWAGGAEAMAINGIRLTPTSAIRFAGEVVLVDFRPITSPYRVEAVGDTAALSVFFADSAVASQLRTLDAVGQLSYGFAPEDRLALDAAPLGRPLYAEKPS